MNFFNHRDTESTEQAKGLGQTGRTTNQSGELTRRRGGAEVAKWQERVVWVCLAALVVLGMGAVMPNTVVEMVTYDSVADLAANGNPASYVFRSAYTRGYYAPGDGGGGHYLPTNSVTSTNLGSRIKALQGGGAWSWDLDDKSRMNVKQWGFKGDDATDNAAALTSLGTVLGPGVQVEWPNGTYRLNTGATIAKSNFTFRATTPLGAKIKLTTAAKVFTGIVMQGDGWKLDGLEIDWQQNASAGLYCDNYHHGWTIVNCYIHGAYADHSNDPSDATEVANVAIRRGNYDWTISDSDLSGADCLAAGTRTSAGLAVTDFGWATSADSTFNGLVRRVKFDSIGPGGLGDAVRLNMTASYDSRIKIVDCDFGLTGFRGVKLIGNGAVVRGNTFNNTDTNARCAIEDFGDNNIIEGNSIVGTYAFGISGGSTLGITSRHGIYGHNHVRFTGGAITTGIGFRFTVNTGNGMFMGNSVTDAAKGFYADGKFNGNTIDGLSLTNIAGNGVELASDGSFAPDSCQVNNVTALSVGGFAVSFTAGSNLDCGLVTGAAVGKEVFYGAGVTGKITPKTYGDGLWRDWNGVPMVGSGWIWDECLSGSYLLNTSSTLNTGTASLSGSVFDANHSGAYSVGTASATNAVGTVRNGGTQILFGTRTVRACFVVKTPAALSSATDKYELFTGIGDATTAANTDGAFFDYTHDFNSGNWTGKTCSGGVFTTASGGSNVAVTANAYWWLGVEGNSSSAKFYVALDSSGGPGTWTLIGTSAANLPTAGTTGFIHEIIKQAGSTGTTTETYVIEKVGYQP